MGSLSLKASVSSTSLVAGRERSLIPVGMSTILPAAARRIRHLEQTLLDGPFTDVRMQCSREERGGKALLIFGLDAPLPAPVLDQITNSKHILSVKVADLSKGL